MSVCFIKEKPGRSFIFAALIMGTSFLCGVELIDFFGASL